jgi:hypothetical protein
MRKKLIISCLLFVGFTGLGFAQTVSVRGMVKDPQGNSIPFASIKIKNTNLGTSSDSLGVFHLQLIPKDLIVISAIGFADTTLSLSNMTDVTIMLRPKTKSLNEVIIAGNNQNTGLPSPEESTREEIITNTFENYLRGAEFSSGIIESSQLVPKLRTGTIQVRTTISGFGDLNTINSGEMLPVMEHKEDTKGSRYLLNRFAKGLIVDQHNNFILDSANLLNYDKIDGKLMIAQDGKNYLEVDKEKVVAFAFRTPDSSYVFINVPILSKTSYFLLIANGPKYSVYKSIKTKFVKSTYVSNGLVESGNNYDEYVDNQTYYWIDQKNNRAGILELKKRSIKDVFGMEKQKTEAYFAKHKFDELDDGFLRNFIDYLNQ